MLNLMQVHFWPLWIAVATLAAAALIHLVLDVVPNGLVLSSFVAACLIGLLAPFDLLPGARGNPARMILCMCMGGVVPMGLYVKGWAPGGTVKMHLALMAWIGVALPQRSAIVLALVVTLAVIAAVGLAFFVANRIYGSERVHKEPESERSPFQFPIQLVASVVSIAAMEAVAVLEWVQ